MTSPRSEHVAVLAERAYDRLTAVTNPGDETGAVAALTVTAQTLASYSTLIRRANYTADAYTSGVVDGCARMAEVFAAAADLFDVVDVESAHVLAITGKDHQ